MSDAETDNQNDSDEVVYHRCNVDSTLLILSKVFLSTTTWTLMSPVLYPPQDNPYRMGDGLHTF